MSEWGIATWAALWLAAGVGYVIGGAVSCPRIWREPWWWSPRRSALWSSLVALGATSISAARWWHARRTAGTHIKAAGLRGRVAAVDHEAAALTVRWSLLSRLRMWRRARRQEAGGAVVVRTRA